MFREPRPAFAPEALSTIDHTMDEVWRELLADGVFAPSSLDGDQMRTKLAQKVVTFASSGWSLIQIKQLLLRTFRNERSAAAHKS